MVNNIVSLYLLNNINIDKTLETYYNDIMVSHPNVSEKDETSILWSRTFGEGTRSNDKQIQPLLHSILSEYNKKNNHLVAQLPNEIDAATTQTDTAIITYTNATHIAIGHTPQFTKGINSICNNTVWRCDIGMSKAFLTHNNTRTKSMNNSKSHVVSKSHASGASNGFKHGDIQILQIKDGLPSIINE